MTNEEKARAYDEALERAREMLNMILDNELIGFPDQIREIFPQLKESEDERIRKFLIQHISEWIGCIEQDLKNSSKDIESEKELAMFKAGLAYLEKQKENTWSEEDDAKVKAMCKEGDLKPSERAWLKNLRNRVWKEPQYAIRVTKGFGDPDGPQFELVDLQDEPKQEWSEEDEKIYNKALDAIYYKDLNDKDNIVDALKALCDLISRKRKVIPPYARWKPSEEQMKALNALNCHGDLSYVGQQNQLVSLYQDLKKQM